MEKTGERYVAARRSLIDRAAAQGRRARVSEPEMSDEAVADATGRGWDEWCEVIEAWPGHRDGHAAIAAWLQSEHDVGAWWAQGVTVGYERITGLRLPHQMADGTFTSNKSMTLAGDAALISGLLRSPGDHADLFPGNEAVLRSGPDAKTVRIGIGGGVASFDVRDRGDGRCTVTVAHEKLTSLDDVERWKFYWQEWLEALGDG